MAKRLILLTLFGLLIAVFSFQAAMAYNPNWKAEQDQMFKQMGIKPGDVIDSKNWEKAKDLIPESILAYLKQGGIDLKIGEMKYDYGHDEAWEKAGEANRGKYGLGNRKEIVDRATGKFPTFVYGRPFPDEDKDDPNLGIKLMHNKSVDRGRAGMMYQDCATVLVGQGGVERALYNQVWYYFYWAHPDGEQQNPNNYKFAEMIKLTEPYDLAGTVVLTLRHLDGSPDLGGSYVPALRRVRRTSGSNRSDPFFGSDIVVDDSGGWGGQDESMTWKVIDEKEVLIPKSHWQADSPDLMVKQPNGSWKGKSNVGTLKFGCDEKNTEGTVWAPLHAVWVPRKVYLIEATPIDPYYNYGKCLYYIDKKTLMPVYKIVKNKAGEYWKTLIIDQYAQQWGDDKKQIIDQPGWYIVLDDKSHHATVSPVRGTWRDWDFPVSIMDPNMNSRMFTFENIATMSK